MPNPINAVGEFVRNPVSGCLTADQIVAYAEGSLSPEARRAIELHITECDLCAEAVQGGMTSRDLAKDLDAIRRIRTAEKPGHSKPTTQMIFAYAAAALVVITIGVYVFMRQPAPGEVLFAQYFSPYPNSIPLVRGAESTPLEEAMMRYELGEYDAAATRLAGYIEGHPGEIMPLFYLGVADLAHGDARSALSSLSQVSRSGDARWAAQAQWYLALAYLRLGDQQAARESLNQLIHASGEASARASDLLLHMHP